MPIALIVTIIIVAVVFGAIILATYMKLVKLNSLINDAWAEISFQSKRRADLIPKLTDIIKKNLKNEKKLVEVFIDAEKKMAGARTMSVLIDADRKFTEAFSYLIMVSESNSKLKTDTDFQQLISEFLDIEEKVQVARRAYNIYSEKNNAKLNSFPANLINSLIGHFEIRQYYELDKPKKKR
ncbi:LemA family protein [Candidatus Saccharibacteria bacterium]|nr:LemA family protein [Candidatus Saccharibacteria bacterium]